MIIPEKTKTQWPSVVTVLDTMPRISAFSSYPQVIEGAVLDERRIVIVGATVMLKGTRIRCVTDGDGKFRAQRTRRVAR